MFSRLIHPLTKPFKRAKPKKTTPYVHAVARHHAFDGGDNWGAGAQYHAYQGATWVYVGITRIAEASALVPLHVLRMEGETRHQIDNHPLETLLDNPNPYTSRFELLEQTLGYLEITGNAYWYLVGDGMGKPMQIWALRPDRVSIVPDEKEYVKGYVYEIGGTRIPFEASEIVHFKRWHPTNDYYGMSALTAGSMAIRSDQAMAKWNANTFGQDNGVPAGIVNIRDHITDSDFERIKRDWRNSYGGAQRRTAFLRGGSVEWQNIGLSHTDLDFLQGRQAHRDEILNLLGLPVGLVSENATEANARVAERQFIERTLYPRLVRIGQKITQEILPFYGQGLIAEFEDIRPTDTQTRLQEIQTARGILTVDEIREQFYNLPPLPSVTEPEVKPETDEQTKVEDEAPDEDAIQAELKQWQRYATKRLGVDDARPFNIEVIPDEIAQSIHTQLADVETAEAIRTIFDVHIA